jgi:hypothetical protein
VAVLNVHYAVSANLGLDPMELARIVLLDSTVPATWHRIRNTV